MAEVLINDKVKTHEEGKHTYIGKYKGNIRLYIYMYIIRSK